MVMRKYVVLASVSVSVFLVSFHLAMRAMREGHVLPVSMINFAQRALHHTQPSVYQAHVDAQVDVLLIATEMSQQAGAGGMWVILVHTNAPSKELTLNWICNLKRLDLEKRLQSTIFLAIDQQTYDQLDGYHRVKWFVKEEEFKFGTKPFDALMQKRTRLIHKLLSKGIKVFLCETDQVWLADPVAYVAEHYARADFVTYDASTTQNGEIPFGDFLFLNPTGATVKLWGTLVEKRNTTQSTLLQTTLSNAPAGMSVGFLPADTCKTDKAALEQGPMGLQGCLLVHVNAMFGSENKRKALRETAMWHVDENGACSVDEAAGRAVVAHKLLRKATETVQHLPSEVLLLAKRLSQNAGADGWVIVVLASQKAVDFTHNWICNLQWLGLTRRLQATLFLAIDQTAFDQLEGYHRVKLYTGLTEELKYRTKPYDALMQKRTWLISTLLKAGIKLFVCETDQLWLADPVAYVTAHHSTADIVTHDPSVSSKDSSDTQPLPYAGFLFLNPSPATVGFWVSLAESCQQEGRNEHRMLRAIMTSGGNRTQGLKIEFLPEVGFTNGKTRCRSPSFNICDTQCLALMYSLRMGKVMIRVNDMVGSENKKTLLQSKGFWYTQLNGACIAS